MRTGLAKGGTTLEHSFRDLDDLVLHLKGLVLVRKLRERRGADAGEVAMYTAEIERVRERLAELVRSGNAQKAAA
jgi:hypothetical protein